VGDFLLYTVWLSFLAGIIVFLLWKVMMSGKKRARLIVDPNVFARGKPWLSVILFDECSFVPEVGETVTVVQPHVNEPDYVGVGIVESRNDDFELLYVWVDWKSFSDDVPVAKSKKV
jgi:hypothetical protein